VSNMIELFQVDVSLGVEYPVRACCLYKRSSRCIIKLTGFGSRMVERVLKVLGLCNLS